MATLLNDRAEKNWQRVRTGLMSAALLKPAFDRFMQSRAVKNVPSVDRLRDQFEDQIELSQQQIEKLTRVVAEVVEDLADQIQQQTKVTTKVIRHMDRRVWWASGIAVGFGIAGLAAYVVTRRRMQSQDETAELIEITEIIENGYQSPADQLRDAANGSTTQRDTATRRPSANGTSAETAAAPTSTTVAEGERLAAEAPFIGNLHTQVYHLADSENLPGEENRVYFFSEEEARDSGYRPAQGE